MYRRLDVAIYHLTKREILENNLKMACHPFLPSYSWKDYWSTKKNRRWCPRRVNRFVSRANQRRFYEQFRDLDF